MNYQAHIDGQPVNDDVVQHIVQCSLANIGHTLPPGMAIAFRWCEDDTVHISLMWPDGSGREYSVASARGSLYRVPMLSMIPDTTEVSHVAKH